MQYKLERLVEGEWCYYGTYDLTNKDEIEAMLRAAQMFSGLPLRVVKV